MIIVLLRRGWESIALFAFFGLMIGVEFCLSVLDFNFLNLRLDLVALALSFSLFGNFPSVIVLFVLGVVKDVLFSMPMGLTPLSYVIVIFCYRYLIPVRVNASIIKSFIAFASVAGIIAIPDYIVLRFFCNQAVSFGIFITSFMSTSLLYGICISISKFFSRFGLASTIARSS